MEWELLSRPLPVRIPAQVPLRTSPDLMTIGDRVELARRVLAALRNLPATRPSVVVCGCSWCGGSGVWTDPETGAKWPCIQCRSGRDGSDN